MKYELCIYKNKDASLYKLCIPTRWILDYMATLNFFNTRKGVPMSKCYENILSYVNLLDELLEI